MSKVTPKWLFDEFGGATISDCGKYRSWLQRGPFGRGVCIFIMMNPSTADAMNDDPTIRRCKSFTRREGLDRLVVVNLFTRRSPYPRALWETDEPDPVGPDADSAIDHALTIKPSRIICAWGKLPKGAPEWFATMWRDRVEYVAQQAAAHELKALGINADGSPKHPLYIPDAAPLLPFDPTKRRAAA